jgi:hypothetical protein
LSAVGVAGDESGEGVARSGWRLKRAVDFAVSGRGMRIGTGLSSGLAKCDGWQEKKGRGN